MDAVIVAAGRGTRMRPLTDTRPKPLLPIGETTLLERILKQCRPVVDRFVIVVGYRAEMIREAIDDAVGETPVRYVRQDDRLGTAHAIGQAADAVSDPFLALNGDVVIDDRLVEQLAGADGHAIATTTVEDPTSYGVVDVEDGQVTGLYEKPDEPPSNRINVGLYRFDPTVFDAIERTDESPRGEYEITDTIELLLAAGEPVEAIDYAGTWLDIGRPWELLSATERVLSELERSIEGTVEPDAHLHGPVVVESGARVRSGAYVEGPVVIRSGADVGPNAYVRGPSVIGPEVRVGNAVEVKASILMAETAVGHLSYVGDSVLGAGVNFGAGTIVANLRHDDEPVRMTVKGDRVDTGRRKLGVVVGDGTKTGIDTSLNAGVKLGPDSRTTPGENVLSDRVDGDETG